MLETTERFSKRWDRHLGETLDVNEEMMRLTMFVISKLLFGIELVSEAEKVSRAVTDVNRAATSFDLSLMGYWSFLPTRTSRSVKRAVRDIVTLDYGGRGDHLDHCRDDNDPGVDDDHGADDHDH